MKKIYILDNNMSACKMSTVYCGVTVNMEFRGGNSMSKMKASLCTDNPFAQDAIEHDSRFGSEIKLYKVYKGDEEEQPAQVKEEAKKVAKVKNINAAISYFSALGETVERDEDIPVLCEKYNVAFPNLK